MLAIRNLRIEFKSRTANVAVVDGVSLDVPPGRIVAVVGESGSGKTLTSLAILRLVPAPGRIAGGRIELDGRNLTDLDERELRNVRGRQIAMIFQEPMTSLNPVLSVGEQIAEPLRIHKRMPRRAANARAIELLGRVGIASPEQRVRDYPHQLSGGMRQRVMIAMAISCEPAFLIADEPTTALDVTIQRQILGLLRDLQQQSGMGILFITHDLALVAEFADDVCVMYAGRIVERAGAATLFAAPRHPYTQALLRSVPGVVPGGPLHGARRRLPIIPGDVPRPETRPPGCAFHPRCDLGRDEPICRTQMPALELIARGHDCACWKSAATAAITR